MQGPISAGSNSSFSNASVRQASAASQNAAGNDGGLSVGAQDGGGGGGDYYDPSALARRSEKERDDQSLNFKRKKKLARNKSAFERKLLATLKAFIQVFQNLYLEVLGNVLRALKTLNLSKSLHKISNFSYGAIMAIRHEVKKLISKTK